MAKPRTPTNVLTLKGSFKTHPERKDARAAEPDVVGDIGDPPADFDESTMAAWKELAQYAPPGVLCQFDRPFMVYAAKVWAEIKASHRVDPKVGIRFEAVIARLGMSPADRSRVSVIKPAKTTSPLDEFATG